MIERFTKQFKRALSGDLGEYRSIPFWSWNNELDEKSLTDQIEEMKKVGIGGFVIHARTGLKTPYLGEKWFSCVEACLNKAKELKMNVWIYDENGWPSGFVGGKLLKNEAYRARFLEYEESDKFDENALCCYVDGEGGYRRVFGKEEGEKVYHNVYLRISPSATDILNPEVVSAFISETHEKYYSRFSGSFGKELVGFFTDEPQYYRWATPYPSTVRQAFKEQYGEDVYDGLIYLFKDDERGYKFRTRYYGVLSRLYNENYYKRLYDWCEEHGCKLTGHSVEEPHLYSQMWGGAGVMPTYEYEHIPAIDSLTREGEYFLSFRQVASVAAQLGKKFVLTETFGCSGYDVTPTELKHIGEMQYFCGINLMCQHLLPYSVAGQGKHDCPPVFYKQNNWWEEFGAFNEHFTRLGYLVANSVERVDVLIIHPMRSVYLTYIREADGESVKGLEDSFSKLLKTLNDSGVTYHFADETLLAKYGKTEGNRLIIGNFSYDTVIVPQMPSIASSTLRTLSGYKGKLCIINTPEYIDGERAEVGIKGNTTIGEIVGDTAVYLRIKEGDGIMTEREYFYGDKSVRFTFIKNLSLKKPLVCDLGDEKRYAAFDIDDMTFTKTSGEITLEGCGSVILAEEQEEDVGLIKRAQNLASSEDITGKFKVGGMSENLFVSDNAEYSFDGKEYFSKRPLPRIFENLLYERYNGKIYIKHTFSIAEKMPLKLVAEKYDFISATFNGYPVNFKKSQFDIKFVEADVTDCIKEGVNEYIYCLNYTQREEVRFAFFDPLATEALRNCLYYDTYIENVYLKGDFVVGKDGALSRAKNLPEISSEMYKNGYPFFYGELKLKGGYFFDGDGRRSLYPVGRFLVAEITVNGKKKSLVYSPKIDVTDMLEKGENEIEIVVKSSLRNLFGPHHFKSFTETDWVGPDKFTQYRMWKGGVSPNYDEEYNLVPFGVDKIIIEKYK